MNPAHAALFKLGIAECIQLVDDLWAGIASDEAGIGLTEEVRAELHRRKTAFDKAPKTGRTWEQVKCRVRTAQKNNHE